MESVSTQALMKIVDPDALQFYSAQTPNGLKVAVALEELVLLESLKQDFKYEPHTINIRAYESHKPEFTCINPNAKIPALKDPHGPGGKEVTLWESGSILLYLAEKYHELIPIDPVQRLETINWLYWASTGFSSQVKSFGFYYKYCSHKLPYCITRHQKEVDRLLAVLETQLKSHNKHWIMGDMYTIADIAAWSWVYGLLNNYDDAQKMFNNMVDYPSIMNWYNRIISRPAVMKAMDVTPFVV